MHMETSVMEKVIRERRTIRQFNGKPLAKETIMHLLEAAVWAPVHSRKEPWRFILFVEEGRKQFSDAVLYTFSQRRTGALGTEASGRTIASLSRPICWSL